MIIIEQIFDSIPARGWLDKDELTLLLAYAFLTEGDILEVGSYCGRSTVALAFLDRTVHAVDPFDNFDSDDLSGESIHKTFLENTQKFENIILYKQKIEDWDPRPVGFVYLDGDHTYQGTINQIKRALLCGPEYIAIHDVNDDGGGFEVHKAAKELLGNFIIRSNRTAVFNNPKYEQNKI